MQCIWLIHFHIKLHCWRNQQMHSLSTRLSGFLLLWYFLKLVFQGRYPLHYKGNLYNQLQWKWHNMWKGNQPPLPRDEPEQCVFGCTRKYIWWLLLPAVWDVCCRRVNQLGCIHYVPWSFSNLALMCIGCSLASLLNQLTNYVAQSSNLQVIAAIRFLPTSIQYANDNGITYNTR